MKGNSADRMSDTHERARRLILASRVEGVAADERQWLDAHLEQCAACAKESSTVAAVLDSFRAAPVVASDDLVHRTRLAVRRRSELLAAERARTVPLRIAVAFSAIWTMLALPYTWWTFEWLGRGTGMPDVVWQAGFVSWWFLPATVMAAIVAARQARESTRNLEWTRETSWRRS